jgi:hypothetical protein
LNSALTKQERADRDAMIVALGRQRLRSELIVKRVPGATHAIVSNVLFQARLAGELNIGVRGKYRHVRNPGQRRPLLIPPDVGDMLKPAAEARGISVIELAKHVLIAVADSGLVDAVLDDGVKSS